MTEDEFWAFIARSREKSAECQGQAAELAWLLSAQPAPEIQSFDDIFAAKRQTAYRWDLWGAAYIINGGCSDDGFEYFRCWLIGQGRAIYEGVIADPDSLAEIFTGDEDNVECEDLLYAADRAHEDLMGTALPARQFAGSPEPQGEQWNENDLGSLFPRLSAKFC